MAQEHFSKGILAKDLPMQKELGPFLCFRTQTSYLNDLSVVRKLYKLLKAKITNLANGSLKSKS